MGDTIYFKLKRKKIIIESILLIFFFLSTGMYIYADYKGAEKGVKSIFFSMNLPYDLHPFVDGHSSFVLKDSNDIEVLGIGFRYVTMASPIRDIMAYGHNEFSIIVLCDCCDSKKFLITYIDKYNSVSFREISYEQAQNASYHWVDIKNTDYDSVTKIKSWSFVFALCIFLCFCFTKRYV